MQENNYDLELEIDESALDIEWLEQPRLFLKYGQLYAEAKRDYDFQKDRLAVIQAGLDRQIRANPEMFGLGKVTEATVLGAIQLDESYQDQQEMVRTARYEMELLSKAVQAFDQRKGALENLVRLHGQSYFSGPKVPRNIEKERREKQEVDLPAIKRGASRKGKTK